MIDSSGIDGAGISSDRRIGLAAATGVVAKGLAFAAQVLAVAIAVRTLGVDGFALYVVVGSLVSWIGLAGLGVAPGLTLGVARAAAISDRVEEARLFVVALVLMSAISAALVGFASFLAGSGLLERFTAGSLGPASGGAATALFSMALLIAVQMVVAVPEAAQLGLQSQYVANVWAGIGSAAAIIVMVTLGAGVTSVAGFLLVSQGPQVAARAVNGTLFVIGRHYPLRPPGLRFREHARPILSSGIGFAGFQIASYLGLQVGLLILATGGDPAPLALAGVIVRGYTLETNGLALVTTPTWPAIANAISRGDLVWVRRTYRRLSLGAFFYAGLAAVIIFVGLETLIEIWTGTRPNDDLILRALLAAFVLVNGWAHVNAMTLVGLGALRFAAIVLIAESVLVLGLQAVFVPIAGVVGYVGALAAGAVMVSGWVLGLRVRFELRRRSAT